VSGPEGFAKTVPVPAPADGTEVSGLKNGVEYSFTVVAATRDGSAAPSQSVSATPTTGMEGVVAGLIVEFAPGSEQAQGERDVPGHERVPEVDLVVAEKVSDDAVLVELSEPVDVDTATRIADDLAADEQVAWAEPDQFFFTSTDNTSTNSSSEDLAQTVTVPTDSDYASSQWNLWDSFGITIGDGNDAMTDAWAGPRGDDVTVAVIDTGITDHPDLVNQLVPGYDFVSNPEKLAAVRQANAPPVAFDGDYVDEATYGALGRDDNPTDPGDWRGVAPVRDSSWHGTKIAGLIAAEANNDGITGIAPGAKIQPIRALSWRGGLLSDIAASITWASGGTIDGVPTNANPSKVINMSFAVETICPVALQDAIDGAIERGSILVAAAGNASDDAAKFAPGNCNGVITVAATNRDGQRADYSNYGETIDVAAPGGDAANPITVTTNTGTQTPDTVTAATTGTDSGTSLAAAHVSATAAILASRNANLTPDQAYQTLTGNQYTKAFGNDVCDADKPDYSCGTGILTLAQIAAAVTSGACVATVNSTTGVTVARTSNDCVVTFAYTGTSNAWTVPTGVTSVRYLVVAGGGGGSPSGGGGAGGLLTGNTSLTAGAAIAVAVGAGGGGGTGTFGTQGGDGGNSTLGQLVAVGGGGAGANAQPGSQRSGNGRSGGSGGGAGAADQQNAGGAGTAGQGFAGGNNRTNSPYPGGGGGGAGAAGGNASGNTGGAAGPGLNSNITGTLIGYAGGGAGAARNAVDPGASAAAFGGGTGAESGGGGNGTDGRGGGGGGARETFTGGAGGSGVVIVRYALASQAALSVNASPSTLTSGQTASLSTSGGSGSGSVTYSTSGSCSISGSTLTANSGTGTCTITATKAAASNYLARTASTTVTLALATQAVSWAPDTSLTTLQSPHAPSTGATALGGALISYSKVSSTTDSCSVDSSTGQLTYTGHGNCVVRATAQATSVYAQGTKDVTFTIKDVQTITFNDPAPSGATYGDSAISTTASSSSMLAVTLTSADTGVCSASGTAPNFTIDINGAGTCQITASQPGDGTYVAATDVIQSFTVAQAPLTLSGVTADNKDYDGTTSATLNFTGASLVGRVSGDGDAEVDYDGSSATGTFASATAGDGVAVTVTGVTLTGTKASSYTLTQPTGVTANIEKAAQATLTAVSSSPSLPVGQSATLSTTGGSGTGAVTFVLDSGNCTLVGTTLTAGSSSGSCVVTATKESDDNYLAATALLTVPMTTAPAITIVTSGGDSPGSGWSLSGGVITAWQDVSIAKSNIETALVNGNVRVESLAGSIVVASGATITSSAANALTLASNAITIDGGVDLSNAAGTLILEAAAPNDDVGTASLSASASVTAGKLLMRNVHRNLVASSATVDVDVLAAVGGHRLLLTNENAVTIGTVDGVAGISSYTDWVIVATKTGDLTVAQPVGTSATSSSFRLRLTAGAGSPFGTATGGNVIVSGSGAFAAPNAVTQIFSGTAAGSTGLGAVANAVVVAAVAPTVAAGQVAVAYRAGPPEFFSPTTMRYDETLDLVAVDPGGGSVTFSQMSGPCTLATTTVTTVSPTGAGSCVVRATGPAPSNLTADQTITISQAPQTIAFTSSVPTSAVSGTTYTPLATSTSGLSVTIDITAGSPGVCSLSGGVVTINTSGTCTIRAQQAGDANYLAATAVTQTIVAGKINQNITFAQPAVRDLDSPAFTLGASVDTGRSVTYATSTSSVCSVGATTGIVSIAGVGDCTITASSAGNASYAAAPDVTRTFAVRPIVPGVPSLTSISFGSQSLTVGFTAPGQNGGATITDYQVVATPTAGGSAVDQLCAATSPCTIGGLTNGTEYRVTLAAINSAGVGPTSAASPAMTPASAPDAVSALSTASGDEQLAVSWGQPSDFGGATFSRYEVYLRESGTAWPGTATRTLGSVGDEDTTFTGLVNGVAYDVKVVVITSVNASEVSSNTAEALGVPMTVPGAPTGLTLTALSATTALAAWSAPSNDGGSPILGYTLDPSCTPAASTDTFCVITGLTPSSTVSVSLTARNLVGPSTSVSENVTLPAAPPAPPAPGPDSGGNGTGGGGAAAITPQDPLTPPDDVLNGDESSVTMENGVMVSTVNRAEAERGQQEIIGSNFSVVVRVQDAAGAPVPMQSSELTVPQGGRVVATGDGYLPGSMVRLFMMPRTPMQVSGLTGRAASGSMFLGETTVDASGDFAAVFAVPPTMSVGEYVLQINGATDDAAVRSVNMMLRVSVGAAPMEPGKAQRAGFFKGLSGEFSAAGKRKLRQIVRSVPKDAQAVQVLVSGVSVNLADFEENLAMAGKRASALAKELRAAGVSGEYTVNVNATFTVDAAERSLVGKADVLTTKSGKPLSTVTVLFQEPV
jgi:subtilisin family serine protease